MKTISQISNPFTRSSRGQSLVEFELALVIMIFMMLAVTDFGLAFFSWITLRDAAQEGATYASVAPPFDTNSVAAIRSRVKEASVSPVNLGILADDHINVDLVGTGTTACPGNGVRVTVTYDYRMISPWIIGAPTIPVSASVTDTILKAANGVTCGGS